ncbi:MAG: hypothetical protein V7725_05720 [Porticoccus sp.]
MEVSNNHADFKSTLNQLDVGNGVLLMSCPDCNQLWRVDEGDKYEACYAAKISTQENWESFDTEPLIKAKMIENCGGLTERYCMWSKCNSKQVKGGTLCVNHLWITGSRV